MEPSAGVKQDALITRRFTDGVIDPFDAIEWNVRDAWTPDSKYYMSDVEAPVFWSDNAVNITAKLYLSKAKGREEKSVRDLINRIAAKITVEGIQAGYFGDRALFNTSDAQSRINVARVSYCYSLDPLDDARIFFDELRAIMVNQFAIFNSPVLFNVGRDDRPQQVSACFILSVDDTTESIMNTAKREAFIFKAGSGSGFDISRLRGSMEPLSTGGEASGPVSFMRLLDAGAGTFKSGGTTRRAAKLVKCDADHPDIRDFITCKVREEERIQMLIDTGVDLGFGDEGERNLAEVTGFQNANNSVGVTEVFMRQATSIFADDPEMPGSDWPLIARKTGKVIGLDSARDLLDLISESAWRCADPGLQYTDTINRMHTTPMLDGDPSPIRSSNPCSEYFSNDDTSCNLGSVNVVKFLVQDMGDDRESFDVMSFRHVVDVMSLSMDICVELADFPDDVIRERTRALRQLGLGYSNMGAAIMAQGMAYDSNEGRDFAASVTALETGRVYRMSARLAKLVGPFHYFEENRDAMLNVLMKHGNALPGDGGGPIWNAADMDWLEAIAWGREHGFRNAQATVIPPAGTTSYFLDCDSTGIEPVFEHKIFKTLAGGGSMTILNSSLRRAANMLGGYGEDNLKQIADGDLSCVSDEDRPVFHTANEISAEGHIQMMAAVQPFVSGAISKTINMPSTATVEDIRMAYVLAWRLGCKSLAIYRNMSKSRQPHKAEEKKTDAADVLWTPLTSVGVGDKVGAYTDSADWPEKISDVLDREVDGEPHDSTTKQDESPAEISPPPRRKLPRTRQALTHKIELQGPLGTYKGYVHAGMYSDGSLAELFVEGFGRAGSFTLNALGRWATAFSKAIQYGIPWEEFARDSINVADETGGMVVPDPEQTGPMPIRSAKSVFDYIVRWLALEFGDDELREEFGVRVDQVSIPDKVSDTIRINYGTVPIDPETVAKAVKFSRRAWGATSSASNGHTKQVELGPPCHVCGKTTRVTGGCFTCPSCFATSGCG